MADNNILTTAVNIITAPREALASLKLKPTVLLPLFAVLFFNALVIFTYYSEVDIQWLIESSLESSGGNITAEQREATANAMENLSPTVMGSISAASIMIFLTLWLFLNAAYLAGVSLLSNDGVQLKQWFALICWCSLPGLFGQGAALVNLLVSDATFLPADRLNPLSISSLLNLESGSSSTRQSIQAIDITALWAMSLVVYGYHLWTNRSLVKSAFIVLAPPVVIFGSILYFSGN